MTTTEVKATEMINRLFIPDLANIILSYYIEPNEHKLYKRIVQDIKHCAYNTMSALNSDFIVTYDNMTHQDNISMWVNKYRYWRQTQNYGYDVKNHRGICMMDQIRNPELNRLQYSLRYFKYKLDIPLNQPLALRKNFINKGFKGNLREKLKMSKSYKGVYATPFGRKSA